MIAHTEKGYFLIKGSKRFRFISDRARVSWKLNVIETSENSIKHLKYAGVIGFRDGTLIRDISTYRIYLISDYKKFHVNDPDVLHYLGFKIKNIVLVSAKEAEIHKYGGVLSA
jgi:hypothetical protein